MRAKDKIKELLKKKVVVLDGAMGTQLQTRGLPVGVCPELWALEHPQILISVHQAYKEAGAEIIYTSTFGANRIKFLNYGLKKDIVEINASLARLARRVAKDEILVAGDIGPLGRFIEPFGELDFEEAVHIFKEQVRGLVAGGVDLLVVETMLDIQEARAALLAVKEITDKFTIVTMSFEKSGRTLSGNDPLSVLVTLQSLGADAFGCNCSTGPQAMLKIMRRLKPYACVPLVAKPNAGLPLLSQDRTIFKMREEEFARWGLRLALAGTNLIGGCCGTSPGHIKSLKEALKAVKPVPVQKDSLSALSSARKAVILERERFLVVGERINPTGKKRLAEELEKEEFSYLRQLAREQKEQGAKLLDVNVGVPDREEKKILPEAIKILSVSTDLPLVIDSANAEAVGEALRVYPGRALVNSISDVPEKIKKLLPLAKRYGAMCILLPVSKRKVPTDFASRKKIIRKLLRSALKAGYTKKELIVDALVLTLSSYPFSARDTLKTIRWCKRDLKLKTIIGLSNLSFGLPGRRLLNAVFLNLARREGLDLAIADPQDNRRLNSKCIRGFLLNQPQAKKAFLERYRNKDFSLKKKPVLAVEERVFQAVIEGEKKVLGQLIPQALTQGKSAIELMQGYLVPAILKVGELFEKKEYFLPQLIASAEVMKEATKILEPYLKEKKQKEKKALILLATVEGDVHDIGKNIVALLLENYGFEVIDLGVDVSAKKIVEEIKKRSPQIVGLSALMTTTMVNMREVISLARQEGLRCKFMVGGAVLNKRYAQSLGADYARDALEAVHLAERLVRES